MRYGFNYIADIRPNKIIVIEYAIEPAVEHTKAPIDAPIAFISEQT